MASTGPGCTVTYDTAVRTPNHFERAGNPVSVGIRYMRPSLNSIVEERLGPMRLHADMRSSSEIDLVVLCAYEAVSQDMTTCRL